MLNGSISTGTSSSTDKVISEILFVTDASFNASSFGITRTLTNLFSFLPNSKISFYVPEEEQNSSSNFLISQFKREYIKLPKKRILSWASTYIEWFNNSLLFYHKNSLIHKPELILICGSQVSTFIAGASVARHNNIPYIIYLMDDLRAIERKKWLGGNGRKLMLELLSNAAAWIMISEELILEYEKRLQIKRPLSLIAHNCVPRSRFVRSTRREKDKLSIAYAGSILGMHYESVLLISKAISILNAKNNLFEFVIYTSKNQWDLNKSSLEFSGVIYGGEILYDNLHQTLNHYDLLLVATTFAEQFRHLAMTSVQTKLTDYMASSRPILSIGPKGCACNNFVEKWQCGETISTNNLEDICGSLENYYENYDQIASKSEVAYKVAWDNFSSEVMHEKLLGFLQAAVAKRGEVYAN
jgi:hypothetical protein